MKLLFRKAALVILMLVLFCGLAIGQNVNSKPKAKNTVSQKAKGSSNWEKSWYIKASLFGTFDSNFDKEPIGTKSFGVIPSLDFGYQLQSNRQRIQLQYTIGVPKYSKFTEYNRRGQYFRGAYRYDLGNGFTTETEGEAILKGANEDRELNNQFIITQKLNYKVTKKDKVSIYGAYRLKTGSTDPNSNAKNPQVGFKYTRQITKKFDAYGGFKYDHNLANGERQRYIRRTFSTGFDYTPTKRDTVSFEARYAPRLYGRLIEVDGLDVPRSDKKTTFDINWRHECKSNFGMENNYTYEKRDSNDLGKKYRNHQVVVSLFYRWGNGSDK
jgi:hypothetical protein